MTPLWQPKAKMGEESSSASEDQWPARAGQHMEGIQKDAYTELAALSGLRTPEEAYEAFVSERITPEVYNNFAKDFKKRFRAAIFWNWVKRLFGYGDDFYMLERAREWFFSEQRPTPYEHPLLYPVLLTLIAGMRDGSDRWGYGQVIPQLLFGTLPTGQINAVAVPVPDSDHSLVMFDFGLFQFTGEMARILAKLLPVQLDFPSMQMRLDMGKAQEPNYAVDQRPELVAHLTEVLEKYLVQGNPRRMPTMDVSETDQRSLAGYLMTASRTFILGHEMGHVLARHLTRETKICALVGRFSTPESVRSWDDEYEADQWGFNYEQLNRAGPEWALAGSTLFFSSWITYERCRIALAYGRTDLENLGSDTHPPATQRWARLQALVKETSNPNYTYECLELGNYIAAIMDALTTRVCPAFQRMHANGLRPFVHRTST